MGSAGAAGRATSVLAWSLLAASLALPAGPGGGRWHPAGPDLFGRPLGRQALLDPPAAPGAGPERTTQVRKARPPASSCRTLAAELCLRWRRGGPFELGRLSEGGQGLSRMPRVFLSIWGSGPQSPRQGGTPQDFASRPVESRPET